MSESLGPTTGSHLGWSLINSQPCPRNVGKSADFALMHVVTR